MSRPTEDLFMTARTAPLIAVVSLIAALGFLAGAMLPSNPAQAQQDPGHAPLAGTGPGVLQAAMGQEVRVFVRRSDDLAMPEGDKVVMRMKMNTNSLSGILAAADEHTIALRRKDTGDAPVLWIPRSSIGYIATEPGAKSLAADVEAAYQKLVEAAAAKPTTKPKP
jgi:hypothetical protein